jgi:hypothetical protein
MMQDILSGTYQYDLCWPHNTLATFIKNNFAIPLDDYIDIDSIEKLRDPVVRASGTMRGKLYIVSEDVPDYGFAPKIGIQLQPIQYNPVIRDREGLPDLFELFKTGSWTWEKLTEIALTATCDINGDGVTDQWGACYFDANALAACMSHSNGMPLIEEVNGRLVHNLATPEFMRAMTIVSDLINVYKVLAPDRTYYIKGTSYMYLGGQFSTHTLVFYRDGKIKSRFVPFPIGPDNDEGKIVSELNKYGYCMPATEKDPNGIARLMVNLFWTMTDPGRPQLTYNEKIESARIYFDSFFWPGASNDLADLLDFWIDGIDGTKYISPSKTDIWLNGFGTLQSAMGTNIFSQLQKATPVSQAVYSAIPKIEGILNEFN